MSQGKKRRRKQSRIDALDIGYAIKDRRAQLGLTQAQVADAAGVSKRCLWSLELGQNPGVQLDKLTAVLKVMGLDLTITPCDITKDGMERRERKQTETNQQASAAQNNSNNDFDALAILTGKAK